eukprot:jgi/Picsp_1/5158/NSC_02521-R1_protein
MSSTAMQQIGKFFRRLGLRAPWQITGPSSSPEYMSHLPKATEYRATSPGSFPTPASVPFAENDRIYDIKYYTRDTRRAGLPGGSRHLVKKELNVGEAPERQMPATPGTPHKWSKPISILDTENNGYTV